MSIGLFALASAGVAELSVTEARKTTPPPHRVIKPKADPALAPEPR